MVIVAVFVYDATSSIHDAAPEHQLRVWSDNGSVFVSVPDNDTYHLFNVNGIRVNTARGNAGEVLRMNVGTKGIYFVKSRRYCAKVVVK